MRRDADTELYSTVEQLPLALVWKIFYCSLGLANKREDLYPLTIITFPLNPRVLPIRQHSAGCSSRWSPPE